MKLRWACILTRITALYVDRLASQVFAPYGISLAQFKILMFLYNTPEDTATTAALEDFFQMSHSTSVELLNHLEKDGWILRIHRKSAGRAKVIHLTDLARDKEQEIKRCGAELEQAFIANLSEEEVDDYVRLSYKIIQTSKDERFIQEKAGNVFNWNEV